MPTLDAWAIKGWKILEVRPDVLRNYKYKYYANISPHLGRKELGAITVPDIRVWMRAELTPTQARAALPILQSLFRIAMENEVITSNPTLGIRKPAHIAKRRDFLTLAQVDALELAPEYLAVCRFLGRHGLRWSEYTQMRETDFVKIGERMFIRIERSVNDDLTKGGKYRYVPYMGGWTPDMPKIHWRMLRAYKAASGGCVLHSLRKTYAYWLKTSGVHVQVAQRLLGHGSITLTMDIYTDVLDEELIEAAGQMEMLLPADLLPPEEAVG